MKAVFLAVLIPLHILVHIAAGAHDLFTEYRFSAVLADDDYTLHWNVDLEGKEISFAINVLTTGWVGFGISPNGQMPGSDVVIAWVDDNGQVSFNDRYAAGRFLPPIDDSQDWTLISGEEEDGRTIIEFTRPFLSCDTENDLDIFADTSRIVWAYHSLDPTAEEDLGALQHERMGSSSLNLLGGLNEDRVEEEGSSFTILNDNVLIPGNDTTYWCSVHTLPDEIATQEKFIYKFSPALSDSSGSYVHHVVMFLCTNLDHGHVGTSEACIGTGMDIGLCRNTGVIIAVWALGGPDFVFPTGVGYPIGGKGQQFLIIETHFDNPSMVEGVYDNSGLEFFFTNEPPEKRAGLLTLGQRPSINLIIPPNADNFVVNAMCSKGCTTHSIPGDGITVFGNLLHTHLAGYGLVVRHLRETTACGGVEELQPIDDNPRYDFNYQQTTLLPQPAQVLPGDTLHLECSYRTSDPFYQSVTLGGESTREEMCYAFMYYYPEVELNFCTGFQLPGEEFAEEYLRPGDNDLLRTSIFNNDHQSVRDILDQVEWNQQSVNSFQNSIQSNVFRDHCWSKNLSNTPQPFDVLIPQVDCPYVAESKDCISGAKTIHYFGYTFLLGVAFLQRIILNLP